MTKNWKKKVGVIDLADLGMIYQEIRNLINEISERKDIRSS